tara:strand:+ start:398 stop:928 length:531 start_codon:yes stop_codon:yes gene_type:complete
MTKPENIFKINEKELMEHYGFSGSFAGLRVKLKFLRSWIHHSISYSSPHPGIVIFFQRLRGVKIGNACHIAPYVFLDLMYPDLITIEDNVGIGSNTMIFAHINPTANNFLKNSHYPRKTNPVIIKSGAWINPGCIIGPGTIIGKNSILSVGTVITGEIPDNCVVAGNPGRIIKKIG